MINCVNNYVKSIFIILIFDFLLGVYFSETYYFFFLKIAFSVIELYLIFKIISSYASDKLNFIFSLKERDWYKNHLHTKIQSPLFLSLFRIFHSLVCIYLVFQLITEGYIDFKFYGSSEEVLSLLKNLHYIWFFFILIILLGTGSRIFYLIHFLFCYHFFESNIGDQMIKIAAFWSIFMIPQGPIFLKLKKSRFSNLFGFKKKAPYPTPSWAVFLLGINLSFVVTIAGIYKALDPVWLEGHGFYYSFLQPWIRVKESSFLLNEKWFIYPMNYLAILFETLPLFFFPFKKLRPISIFFLFSFLILVLYPLRIDPVAPAGLVILIAILSLQRVPFAQNNFYNSLNTDINDRKQFTTAFLLLVSQFMIVSYLGGLSSLKYPFTSKPFYLSENYKKKSTEKIESKVYMKDLSHNIKSSIINIPKGIVKLIYNYRILDFGSIFNYHHSFARSIYFIDAYSEKKSYSPFRIYNKDGSINEKGLRSGFLRPLNAHVVYGQLGLIYHKLTFSKEINVLSESDFFLLKRIFHFSKIRFEMKKIKTKIKRFHIRIYPINVPNDYVGDFKNISEEKFAEISYDVDQEKFNLIEVKGESRNFNLINISSFKNGKIIFDPIK